MSTPRLEHEDRPLIIGSRTQPEPPSEHCNLGGAGGCHDAEPSANFCECDCRACVAVRAL